jgi:hypothetical protein
LGQCLADNYLFLSGIQAYFDAYRSRPVENLISPGMVTGDVDFGLPKGTMKYFGDKWGIMLTVSGNP